MVHEFFPKFTESDFGSHPRRMLSVSYVLFGPFHGGNTGSNPVGDANKINDLPHLGGGEFLMYVKGTSLDLFAASFRRVVWRGH